MALKNALPGVCSLFDNLCRIMVGIISVTTTFAVKPVLALTIVRMSVAAIGTPLVVTPEEIKLAEPMELVCNPMNF